MIQSIRDVEKSMGSGIKDKSALESEEMYTKARRSIHAKSDILKGERITKDLLIIKRPGFGIKPKFIEHVIGKSAKTDIREDEWITWDKIE